MGQSEDPTYCRGNHSPEQIQLLVLRNRNINLRSVPALQYHDNILVFKIKYRRTLVGPTCTC